MKSGVSGLRKVRYTTSLARPGRPHWWKGTIQIKALIYIVPLVGLAVQAAWAGRFLESLLSRLRMHWDHEPQPVRSSRRESALTSFSLSGLTSAATRFRESSIFSCRLSSQREL